MESRQPAGVCKQIKRTTFSKMRTFQLCMVMVALESFISFEELYLLPMLQRARVPKTFVSMPGVFASAFGIIFIPFLGWASNRFHCCSCIGQRRGVAMLTILIIASGTCLLVLVNALTLYDIPGCKRAGYNTDGLLDVSNHSRPRDLNVAGSSQFVDLKTKCNVSTQSRDSNETLRCGSSQAVYGTKESVISPLQENTTQDNTAELTSEYGPLQRTQNHPQLSSSLISAKKVLYANEINDSTTIPNPCHEVINSSIGWNDMYIPTLGIVGILGFALSDVGHDSSMSTMRIYMFAVTHPSLHQDVLVASTLLGAVGGCLTSLLGYMDLSALLPNNSFHDAGAAQCLVQSVILLALCVLLSVFSLSTGSERFPVQDALSGVIAMTSEPSKEELQKTTKSGGNLLLERNQCLASHEELYKTATSLHTPVCDAEAMLSRPSLEETHIDGFVRISGSETSFWKKHKALIAVCTISFLGLVCNYSHSVFVTNYVAEVIYRGDPYGEPDSQGYADYVEGVRMGSLGMLVFYCTYVIFNLGHNKLLASACCGILMLTLVLTANIVVFFVTAITMAVFRSLVYTIPYLMATKSVQSKLETDEVYTSSIAFATTAVAATIPASYFLVSLAMGPLMHVTGNPGSPLFIASAVCALDLVIILLTNFK